MAKAPKNQEEKFRGAISGMKGGDKPAAPDPYASLITKVQRESTRAQNHLQPKIAEWLRRLKIYNNQRRDRKAVGDPLLFTIFQTVIASLYNDEMMTEFAAGEEGDEEPAEALTSLAKNDYDEMEKAELDYYWIWDTGFFGRGILDYSRWDSKTKTPIPILQDPTTFLRDEKATSINGDRAGKGACRYLGRWLTLTKADMRKNSEYFNIDQVKAGRDLNDLIAKAKEARNEAQNLNQDMPEGGHEGELDESEEEYTVLQWFTFWKGKRCMVELANDRKLVIRYKEIKEDYWDFVDRSLYPASRDWDSTSIPDIVEDKQRMRAVVLNLSTEKLKAGLYPSYLFDKNKIKNRADLLNFGFNKFVPSDGDTNGAVSIIPRDKLEAGMVDYILQSLDTSAQRATSTPDMQQGSVSNEKRTLGELNLVASNVDTRYGLAAKIFGWSERRFWLQWYRMYHRYFKDGIHEKIMRIEGAFGAKWRAVERKDLILRANPNIRIQSKILHTVERMKKLQGFQQYVGLMLQVPDTNRRYALRKLGQLYGMEKDEIERLIPPTIDERQAEWENEQMAEGTFCPVSPNDDHIAHLEIHAKAPDTPLVYAHIETHKEALRIQKEKPELFPQLGKQEEKDMAAAQGTRDAVEGAAPAAGAPAAPPSRDARTFQQA